MILTKFKKHPYVTDIIETKKHPKKTDMQYVYN